MSFSLPPKKKIEAWLQTNEGMELFKVMSAIDASHHGHYDIFIPEYLDELCFIPETSYVDPLQTARRIVEIGQIPIRDVHNAVYVPAVDELLLSPEFEFLIHPDSHAEPPYKSSLIQIVHDSGLIDTPHKVLLGVTATIKSNKWNMFETSDIKYPSGLDVSMQIIAGGLANNGILLLFRHDLEEKYELVYPDINP